MTSKKDNGDIEQIRQQERQRVLEIIDKKIRYWEELQKESQYDTKTYMSYEEKIPVLEALKKQIEAK
jgi:hypothetical protein